jgi:energy-coupling factor transporter ATP-binding protein EcfA2
MLSKGSIALIGDTGSGKTTQVGELAEAVRKELGLTTHLATADRGGLDPLEHLVELGVISVDSFHAHQDLDPIVWVNHITSGERYEGGKWVKVDRDKTGLWVFESGTSMGEECLTKLQHDAAKGVAIGGKSSFNVSVGDVKVASNTETHYGLVQGFLRDMIWKSQSLPGLVLWTFRLLRGEDEERSQKLGLLIAGRSLAMIAPSWFRFTFRIDGVPQVGAPARHVLYLQEHTDGSIAGFGNARVPLAGFGELGAKVEPASLPEALRRVEAAKQRAKEESAKRLGIALK